MERRGMFLSACMMVLLIVPAHVAGQTSIQERITECSEQQDRAGGVERVSYCEARPFDVKGGDAVSIEHAHPGGSVSIVGTENERSQVVAIVSARAATTEEARELAHRVEILRNGDAFRVDGPVAEGWAAWQVSFVLDVPGSADVDLTVSQGPVNIEGVSGSVRIETRAGRSEDLR